MVFVNVGKDVLSDRNAQACEIKSNPPAAHHHSVLIMAQLPYVERVLYDEATRL